jgi:hypothetical protein
VHASPPVGAPRSIGGRVVRLLFLAVVLAVGVEGLSSLGMIVHDARARMAVPARSNFRQADYDSLVGWVGLRNLSIPNNFDVGLSLTTNADGMRIHRPTTPALAPGERRLICSGDSFTFGEGVADRDTFCADLEQELPGFRTLNMAQRGFGIDQAYLWYKRDGARYPHQVQVFAFIWHDFERMTMRSFFGYAKPILRLDHDTLAVDNVPVPRWRGASRWLLAGPVLEDSRLLQTIKRRVTNTEAMQQRRAEDQVWPIATTVFRDLERLNHERGSQLALVYLPTLLDLPEGAPLDVRREKLAKFSRESGIPLIDLTPEMRALPPDSLAWMFITPGQLKVDGSSGHYTAVGHRWVAARIADHLRRLPNVSGTLAMRTDVEAPRARTPNAARR